LSRIIRTASASKDRALLEKGIVVAIHELVKQTETDKSTYDLVAYISLSLKAIEETIEESVTAWEKRGYWLKADRYRMEWSWTGKVSGELHQALLREDWGKIAEVIAKVTQKMSKVKVPVKNKIGTPWTGSWDLLIRPDQRH
jgi:hypothetical protein